MVADKTLSVMVYLISKKVKISSIVEILVGCSALSLTNAYQSYNLTWTDDIQTLNDTCCRKVKYTFFIRTNLIRHEASNCKSFRMC